MIPPRQGRRSTTKHAAPAPRWGANPVCACPGAAADSFLASLAPGYALAAPSGHTQAASRSPPAMVWLPLRGTDARGQSLVAAQNSDAHPHEFEEFP